MARRPALRALAERLGILSAYEPAGGGRPRPTSDATRVALCAALGHDAASESAARRALRALAAREAERLLEPVQVARAGARGRLRLPAAPGRAGAWEFQLAVEDEAGRPVHERGGRLRFAAARRNALVLPALPGGVHRVRLVLRRPGTRWAGEQTRVAAPRRCVTPRERLGGRRVFGLWTQLYTLRGRRDAGVGNLGDLHELGRLAGRLGAAFVGLNPLHALRNQGTDVSPYAPVSRLFRNPIYLDLEAVPELEISAEARRRLGSDARRSELAALRRASRVDYERTAALQRPVLEALHRAFRERGAGSARGRAYARFRAEQGALLEAFATFQALQERQVRAGGAPDWRTWPAALRRPDGPEVRAFRAAHAGTVDFHAFLQFELDRQLAGAGRALRRAGLPLGLYQDLAIGSAASGFDPWAFPGLFVAGARVGAPPDEYNAAGQDWGLPPLHPLASREDGHRYWRLLLRTGFAHAGALRIDHVMGLFRQYWVPAGRPPGEGAYVRFPGPELLGVLALESRRAGALVVGEDLGTVPRGLPARLARHGVLSSRVLYFERDRRGGFRPARSYSRRALVTANTHDLPSLAAFWSGADLALDRRLGRLGDDAALAAARARRARERRALLRRLVREGCLSDPDESIPYATLCAAVHAFLCRTPAPLLGVSLDDLAGETEPVNVPGVPPERHPSWTRRMSLALPELARSATLRRAAAGLAARRPRGR